MEKRQNAERPGAPVTEQRDGRYSDFEAWPLEKMLRGLAKNQQDGAAALEAALPDVERAVIAAAHRLAVPQGRLVYAGAGTSGRLAVLDGVELTPTFGWPAARMVYLLAGGLAAMMTSIEGAEDDVAAAGREVDEAAIGTHDVVVALAASGSTPYTCAVVTAARARGALTIGAANNPDAPLMTGAEIGIHLGTGPEVLAGSTRLGAGTSQKVFLGVFSTALMARLNKIHAGYMVDMQPTNAKLRLRATQMIRALTGCDAGRAEAALKASGDHIKSAVLIVHGAPPDEVEARLKETSGHLGRAIAALDPK